MPDITEELTEGVLVLTLNRPERMNAFSDEMLDGLMAALERSATDASVGAIVLTGAGRGFSAGGDVKNMAAREDVPLEVGVEQMRSRHRVIELMRAVPKVVIGMINGPAFGAGLGVALACDLRIAGASARFGTAFANVGFSGDFGGSYSLTQLVGPLKARELYLLGEPVDATRAEALGLVTRVVADDALRSETMALAQRLAAGPRIAYGYMKRNLALAETASLKEVLDDTPRRCTRPAAAAPPTTVRRRAPSSKSGNRASPAGRPGLPLRPRAAAPGGPRNAGYDVTGPE